MTDPAPGAVIFASDPARLASFYADLLTLTTVYREADKVVLSGEGLAITVLALPPSVAQNLTFASPPRRRDRLPMKLILPVASLALARERAPLLGGGMDPASSEWQAGNFRACDGFDPEGNVVQFREPLGKMP
ncbi:VOC family protein [Alcanivorax hongdengensis]|nr:VOC family protein [Alcanivorax hongdengensis]